MKRILLLVTVAGRRLAADGVAFIGSRYARRVLVLCAMLTAAMLVGLLGYATSSRADVACGPNPAFCMEKTATPDPVTVGEPLTFTIRGFCAPGEGCLQVSERGLEDILPAGLEFVSATATGPGDPTCSQSAGTVTCAPFSFDNLSPFEATITVIPRECGTFTNTATDVLFDNSASETFTVEGCGPTLPTTKEECKKGGWKELGYPDQGTCITAFNENRP
jgi:uncharacterized protein DUF11